MTLNTILLIIVLLGGVVGFLGHALMLARNPSGTMGGLAPNWEAAPARGHASNRARSA
jgi:hypothetical protein